MKKLIKNQPFPVIKTKRLTLDEVTIEDAKAIFEYQSDKKNFEFVEMPIYTDISQAEKYVEMMKKGTNENKWIFWIIRLGEEAIGSISLWNFNEETYAAETGYGLFSHRGNGYMSEALQAVVSYGIDILGLNRVEAFTNTINEPSIKMLQKNGFTYVSDFKEDLGDGKFLDMVIYKNEG